MVAEYDEYLMSASNSLYILNADEIARKRARDREDYFRQIRTYERDIKALQDANAKKDAALTEKDTILAEQAALIEELRAQLAEKKS